MYQSAIIFAKALPPAPTILLLVDTIYSEYAMLRFLHASKSQTTYIYFEALQQGFSKYNFVQREKRR
jgi:hypothetical protein